jgi:hypothetical protein
MIKSLAALTLALAWPAVCSAQFNPPDICYRVAIDYETDAVQPGVRVNWRPETCLIPDDASWSISPPLPSGMSIHPDTGMISGMPPPNAAQHLVWSNGRINGPGTPRTVTARYRHPITRRLTSFSTTITYTFTDPTPLRRVVDYRDIEFAPGDPAVSRSAWILGGEGQRQYALLDPLPSGYAFDTATGRITGQPTDPHANCRNNDCTVDIRLRDGIGREMRLDIEIANETAYGDVNETCYILVHGHEEDPRFYVDHHNPDGTFRFPSSTVGHLPEARAYWSTTDPDFETDDDDGTGSPGRVNPRAQSMRSILAAGDDRVFYVTYNTHRSVAEAAPFVAEQIRDAIESVRGPQGPDGFFDNRQRRLNAYEDTIDNGCRGAENLVIVAHSMGGVVTNWILGNADPNDRHHRPAYAEIADAVSSAITIQSPHRGTLGADYLCDFHLGWQSPFVYIFGGRCDDGSRSLMTGNEITQDVDETQAPLWTIASHTGMCHWSGCSNSLLDKQNDGLIELHSAMICRDHYGDYSNEVCANRHKLIDGTYNFDVSAETHDTGRNAFHPNAERYIDNFPDPIWQSVPAANRPARFTGSSAAAIDRIFGGGLFLHTLPR